MSILSRLLGRLSHADGTAAVGESSRASGEKIVELPNEPYVFECRACGKVFEARRRRPICPECDSDEVTLMS